MTRCYLEWLVELKKKYKDVEFLAQDDKAKIPIGDKVPISTGVRANKKGIITTDGKNELTALDHDFHYVNATVLVTLICNIHEHISGSFFSGGEEGLGQIFVTVKDSISDPSEVFDHTTQLIDSLSFKELLPTVLAMQTDSGVDHALRHVATKLAMVALFQVQDLDHFVIF